MSSSDILAVMSNLREEKLIDLAIKYAWKFVGIPYRWAGSDPIAGFDCSGLIVELLKATGKLSETQDFSAQALYDMFPMSTHPGPGKLAVYGKSKKKITHIGFCINDHCIIHAGGGGRNTTSIEEAEAADAFVKIRPIHYRKDFVGYCDPFWRE